MAKKKDEKPAAARVRKAVADHTLISDEMKDKLRAKAKERVEELRRQEAEDDFLDREISRQRIEQGIGGDDLKTEPTQVFIDLPPFADSITMDSVKYFNNFSYTVAHHVYDTMVDIMARAWEQQSEIEGKPRRHYNVKRGITLHGTGRQAA